jgi:hypothetical protein
MPLVEILTIDRTFEINQNSVQMLILRPDFPSPERGWRDRQESVMVLTPDGHQIPATAQLSMTHVNISDPEALMSERWRVTISLTDRTSSEVPIGSKILVPAEIKEELLSHNAG